jgi:perosamine synthetase
MVATNDARLAETLRRFRNHGISSEARQRQEAGQWFYEMVLLGFNYRLTDIACALGLSQIGKAGAEPGATAGNCGAVHGGIPGFGRVVVPTVREGVESGVAFVSDPAEAGNAYGGARRNLSRAAGGKYRRECSLHSGASASLLSRALQRLRKEYPVAEDAYERLISLPMFHSMTAQDVEDVIHARIKFWRHFEMSYANEKDF